MKTTLISILLSVSCLVFGQDEKSKNEQKIRKNAFYFELGGNGGLYSINYDRIVLSGEKSYLSLRGGFAKYPEVGFIENSFVFPFETNFIFGKHNNFFEFGVGQSIVIQSGSHFNDFDSYLTLRLGYRYISETGLTVRFGFVPILNDYDSMIWIGLGIGYAF